MRGTEKSLDVFFEDDLVGHVYDTSPLSFEYASQWIQSKAIQIANIKLAAGKSDDASVSAFFENLLPEGQLRIKSASAINLKDAGTRISLAGAQDKATIALFGDGVPRLGVGTSPSTHILKPGIRNIDGVWASAVNETLMMKTALGCGLEAAAVFYEPTTRACVVERFDRIMQYDLCQLSSLPSGKKYEAEGGPSLKDCADLIRKYCAVPAIDLKRLMAWVFFNIFTGNNDSHAKNLSLFRTAVGGVRLTPFYDLMCTRIYPGLSRNFAFNIGGTTIPGEMEQRHISAMAEQLNMRPKYALGIGQEIAKRLPLAMASAAASMQDALKPDDVTMAKRLNFYVVKTAKQASKRMQLGV